MEYRIITGTFQQVETAVSRLLKNDWECQGGISVYGGQLDVYFSQAMTKKDKMEVSTARIYPLTLVSSIN